MSHQPYYPQWPPPQPPPRRGLHPAMLVLVSIGGFLVLGFVGLVALAIILAATGYQSSAQKTLTVTAPAIAQAGTVATPTISLRTVPPPVLVAAQIVPTSTAVPATTIPATEIPATATPSATATSVLPTSTTIPATATTVSSALDQDRVAIIDSVTKTLADYVPSIKITDLANVDYSSVGWTKKEPLVREVLLTSNGVLSIRFSAWPSGSRNMDPGDYGRAELATLEVMANVKALQLNTTLTDISVGAWAPLQIVGDCTSKRMDRMVFIRLLKSQFPLFTYDQWGNVGSNDVYNELKRRGVTTEINAPYRVCR